MAKNNNGYHDPIYESCQNDLSLEEYFFAEDNGVTMTKFQTKLEEFASRIVLRGVFTNEIRECIYDRKLDPRSELPKKYNSEASPLHHVYAKDAATVSAFSEELSKLKGITASPKLFREKLRAFMQHNVYGKGYIKKPAQLAGAEAVERYERNYSDLVNGVAVEFEEGKKVWQYGLSEAQSLIRAEMEKLQSSLTEVKYSISNNPMLRSVEKGMYREFLEGCKRNKIDPEFYSKQSTNDYDKYYKLDKEYLKWGDLYKATEEFRNNGTPFDAKLWDDFKQRDFKKLDPKSLDPKTSELLDTVPPMQIMVVSPFIERTNQVSTGKNSINTRLVSKGIKTFESLKRKISSGHYMDDLPAVNDGIRISIAIGSGRGTKLLLDNIEDIAMEEGIVLSKKNLQDSCTLRVYGSFFCAYTVNGAIPLEIEGPDGKKEIHYRKFEIKIVPEKLLENKFQYGDPNYRIRDAGKPNTKGYGLDARRGKREFIDVTDPLNKALVENLHDKIVKYVYNDGDADKKISELMREYGLSFDCNTRSSGDEFGIRDKNSMFIQQNFNNAIQLLEDIERYLNIDGIKNTEPKLKQQIHQKFVQQKEASKPVGGKNKESLRKKRNYEGEFNNHDHIIFEKAFNPGEIEAYVKGSAGQGLQDMQGIIDKIIKNKNSPGRVDGNVEAVNGHESEAENVVHRIF